MEWMSKIKDLLLSVAWCSLELFHLHLNNLIISQIIFRWYHNNCCNWSQFVNSLTQCSVHTTSLCQCQGTTELGSCVHNPHSLLHQQIFLTSARHTAEVSIVNSFFFSDDASTWSHGTQYLFTTRTLINKMSTYWGEYWCWHMIHSHDSAF